MILSLKSIINYYSEFKEDKLSFEFDVVLKGGEKEMLNISETVEFKDF